MFLKANYRRVNDFLSNLLYAFLYIFIELYSTCFHFSMLVFVCVVKFFSYTISVFAICCFRKLNGELKTMKALSGELQSHNSKLKEQLKLLVKHYFYQRFYTLQSDSVIQPDSVVTFFLI